MNPTLVAAASLSAALAAPAEPNLLESDLAWRVVNDSVMGGVSRGQVTATDTSVVFVGELSLDNNGGFASIRTVPSELDLADAEGLSVTVLGDGRTWWFTVGSRDRPLGAGSYRAPLPTRAGEETTVALSFSDFQYTAYGRPVRGMPPLASSTARIDSVGVLLADKTPGPFTISLLEVRPVPRKGGPPEVAGSGPRDAVKRSLAAALRLGVPAFNSGEPGRCRAHYQTAIESVLLLAPGVLSSMEEAGLQGALSRSAGMDDTTAAWELREAMDRVLLR